MKHSILITVFLMATIAMQAQTTAERAEQRAKNKTSNRVDNRIDQGVDKGLDKTEEAIGSIFKKKDKKSKEPNSGEVKKNSGSSSNTNSSSPKVNSNSDFVPGTKVIFEDRFTKDAIGDFPANWNTNGSGEVVTIDGVEGKWLSLVHNTIANPELKKALPENCTIEFDLFLQASGERSTPYIQFGLTPVKNILKEDIFYKDRFFMNINRYTERDGKTVEYGLKNDVIGNKSDFPTTKYVNKILHVAIAINKTRIRIYLDDKKLIDLPRALTTEMRNNFFFNNNYVIPASELGLLVSNVRIAESVTDARSLLIKQLMEEGKAVTNDILFDVNSDVIKKESFAIINQFGEALQSNATLKIKIVGHTDSDGADAANLTLSQKRAAAVKTYITENYPVAGNRIQTDGKGESQPVGSNTTADGKAKNRRVEFIKL
ncbi:MAG: OmpA family protein [Ferruginibacter sp.]